MQTENDDRYDQDAERLETDETVRGSITVENNLKVS